MSLSEIQKRLKAPKNQFNTFGKYKYRSNEDILEAVKPLLSEYQYSLSQVDEIVLCGERYYIKTTVTLFDGEMKAIASTTAFAREPENKKGIDESQITGAASSYARKYALNGLFAIDDTKDSDTTNTGEVNHPAMSQKDTQKKVDEYTTACNLLKTVDAISDWWDKNKDKIKAEVGLESATIVYKHMLKKKKFLAESQNGAA